MSCRLLDVVLSQAQLDIDSAQVQHVQDLIDNSQHSSLRQPMHPEHAWRLQVSLNYIYLIEDYFQRHCNSQHSSLRQPMHPEHACR
jgi:hypothetical protein